MAEPRERLARVFAPVLMATTIAAACGDGDASRRTAKVVVTEVNLVRDIPGAACVLDVEVENQGPGTAEDVEVTATIENLLGEGAPGHYTVSDTLQGPGDLAEGEQARYWMRPSVPMMPADLWFYTGDLTVADQVEFQFGNVGSPAVKCEE